MVPWAEDTFPDSWTLQQDGASPHISNYSMQYFDDAQIDVLQWPARSPDLGPIENAWGKLVSKVYAHGRQFEYEDDLIEAIHSARDEIDVEYLRTLIKRWERESFGLYNGRRTIMRSAQMDSVRSKGPPTQSFFAQ